MIGLQAINNSPCANRQNHSLFLCSWRGRQRGTSREEEHVETETDFMGPLTWGVETSKDTILAPTDPSECPCAPNHKPPTTSRKYQHGSSHKEFCLIGEGPKIQSQQVSWADSPLALSLVSPATAIPMFWPFLCHLLPALEYLKWGQNGRDQLL